MSIELFEDFLLIEPIAEADVTKGGIVLPEIAKDAPHRAKVIAVGPGKTLENGMVVPIPAQVGDVILHNPYSRITIVINEKKHILIRASELFGRISGEEV